MTEHDHHHLVPVEESPEKPTFSPTQQHEILGAAQQYLRQNKLRYTAQNMEAVIRVISLDGIPRGLHSAGIDTIDPHQSVRKIVRKGIAERKKIYTQGIELKEKFDTDYYSRASQEPVGRYAIPYSMYSTSQKELSEFMTQPNINEIVNMVWLVRERENVLPDLAQLVLNSVDRDVYSQAALEAIPSQDDRAKLIRNMLASLALRQTPNPVLSMEELDQCVQDPDELEELFNEERFEGVFQGIKGVFQERGEVAERYLKDLFAQTKHALISSAQFRKEGKFGKATERKPHIDNLYYRLSKNLLLLHPALEERQLTTHSFEGMSDRFSLWSDEMSESIQGYRVPTVQALLRASRQAEVRNVDTFRFEKAISNWKNYTHALAREDRALLQQQRKLHETEVKIEDESKELDDKQIENIGRLIPNEYKYYRAAVNALASSRRLLSASAKVRERLLEFTNSVREQNNGILPEMIELPDWYIEELTKKAESLKKASMSRANAQFSDALIELSGDLYYRIDPEINTSREYWENQEIEDLHEESERLGLMREDIQKNNVNLPEIAREIPITRLRVRLENQLTKTLEYLENHKTGRIVREERSNSIRLRDMVSRVQQYSSSVPTQREISDLYHSAYIYSLDSRKKFLEKLIQAKQNQEQSYAVDISVPKNASRDEIEDWEKATKISTLSDDEVDKTNVIDFLPNFHQDLRKLNLSAGMLRLPSRLPSAEEFRNWLQNQIDGTLKAIESRESIAKKRSGDTSFIRHAKNRVVVYQGIYDLTLNPLTPIHEVEGLSSDTFIDAMRKRGKLLEALGRIPLQEVNVNSEYTQLIDAYKRYLVREKGKIQREILRLGTSPATINFIKRMKELELVVEDRENSSSDF